MGPPCSSLERTVEPARRRGAEGSSRPSVSQGVRLPQEGRDVESRLFAWWPPGPTPLGVTPPDVAGPLRDARWSLPLFLGALSYQMTSLTLVGEASVERERPPEGEQGTQPHGHPQTWEPNQLSPPRGAGDSDGVPHPPPRETRHPPLPWSLVKILNPQMQIAWPLPQATEFWGSL